MTENTKPLPNQILSDDDEEFFVNYKNCCGGDGDREMLAEGIATNWQCDYHVPMLDAYLLWHSSKVTMENPIPRNGLFADKTPAELQEYIEQMSSKEKALAYMIMTLTMNTCHLMVNKAIAEAS